MRASAVRCTSESWRLRYSIRSAMVAIFRSWRAANSSRSGSRAMVPSSRRISQMTPAGAKPARRARSTAPSVCPARTSTPPRRARSGKTCPGLTMSAGVASARMAVRMVAARSTADLGALGLSGAHQHAAPPRAEREDVPRAHDVAGGRVGPDGGADGGGAIDRRDAAPDAMARVDRDGERGPERRAVLAHHHRKAELVAAALRQREADEPAPVGRHEVDVLGRDALGRDAEVALVLAILVVHEDDHAAGADLGERVLGADHVRALAAGGHRLFG